MSRALAVLVGYSLLLGACTQKMICPAYQSAFIYDKNELRKKYSYFNEDLTPKVLTASKNKYLIAVPESYRQKVRGLQTVSMKPVHPVVPDSLTEKGISDESDFSMAERDLADSAALKSGSVIQDSVYVITKDREVRMLRYNFPDSLKYDPVTGKYVREKPYYYVEEIGYNTEQNNYMWYLRDAIVLPDVRIAQRESGKEGKGSASGKEKKGKKGLFKKKDKKKGEDLTEDLVPEDQEEDLNFSDLDNPPSDSEQVGDVEKSEQKGQRSTKKKRVKSKKTKAPKKKTETTPVKKQEEDDGF